jgi:EPS-associated MarR family transcriptional regulator
MNEYKIIHEIEQNPYHTQRTLADKLDISLGKANYLLAGLIQKGIIKARKLKNHPDNIRWKYILTPKGLQEKFTITRNYLHMRLQEFNSMQQEIKELKVEVKRSTADVRKASR